MLVVGGGVLGWLFADFTSGAVHFMADNCGTEDTPIIGQLVIEPFREHHTSPKAMLEHGFLERNGNSALISLVAISWVPFYSGSNSLMILGAFTCLFTGLWVLITNQIHAWAHEDAPPAPVRALQRIGVLLSKEHHDGHHAAFEYGDNSPPPSNYSITSGFCDILLNPLTTRLLARLNHDDSSPALGGE